MLSIRGGSGIFKWRGGGGGGGMQKIMYAQSTSRAQSVKSITAGIQGLLKGPGSSRVLDALSCYLSLILKHSVTKQDAKTQSIKI